MDREELCNGMFEAYGVEPDFPWNDENAVFRHKRSRKWFALLMEIGYEKLGLDRDGQVLVLNVKCDPLLSAQLRAQDGFHPAYHMNKEQWLTIRLDGSVKPEQIFNLVDMSFDMTADRKKDF